MFIVGGMIRKMGPIFQTEILKHKRGTVTDFSCYYQENPFDFSKCEVPEHQRIGDFRKLPGMDSRQSTEKTECQLPA